MKLAHRMTVDLAADPVVTAALADIDWTDPTYYAEAPLPSACSPWCHVDYSGRPDTWKTCNHRGRS